MHTIVLNTPYNNPPCKEVMLDALGQQRLYESLGLRNQNVIYPMDYRIVNRGEITEIYLKLGIQLFRVYPNKVRPGPYDYYILKDEIVEKSWLTFADNMYKLFDAQIPTRFDVPNIRGLDMQMADTSCYFTVETCIKMLSTKFIKITS